MQKGFEREKLTTKKFGFQFTQKEDTAIQTVYQDQCVHSKCTSVKKNVDVNSLMATDLTKEDTKNLYYNEQIKPLSQKYFKDNKIILHTVQNEDKQEKTTDGMLNHAVSKKETNQLKPHVSRSIVFIKKAENCFNNKYLAASSSNIVETHYMYGVRVRISDNGPVFIERLTEPFSCLGQESISDSNLFKRSYIRDFNTTTDCPQKNEEERINTFSSQKNNDVAVSNVLDTCKYKQKIVKYNIQDSCFPCDSNFEEQCIPCDDDFDDNCISCDDDFEDKCIPCEDDYSSNDEYRPCADLFSGVTCKCEDPSEECILVPCDENVPPQPPKKTPRKPPQPPPKQPIKIKKPLPPPPPPPPKKKKLPPPPKKLKPPPPPKKLEPPPKKPKLPIPLPPTKPEPPPPPPKKPDLPPPPKKPDLPPPPKKPDLPPPPIEEPVIPFVVPKPPPPPPKEPEPIPPPPKEPEPTPPPSKEPEPTPPPQKEPEPPPKEPEKPKPNPDPPPPKKDILIKPLKPCQRPKCRYERRSLHPQKVEFKECSRPTQPPPLYSPEVCTPDTCSPDIQEIIVSAPENTKIIILDPTICDDAIPVSSKHAIGQGFEVSSSPMYPTPDIIPLPQSYKQQMTPQQQYEGQSIQKHEASGYTAPFRYECQPEKVASCLCCDGLIQPKNAYKCDCASRLHNIFASVIDMHAENQKLKRKKCFIIETNQYNDNGIRLESRNQKDSCACKLRLDELFELMNEIHRENLRLNRGQDSVPIEKDDNSPISCEKDSLINEKTVITNSKQKVNICKIMTKQEVENNYLETDTSKFIKKQKNTKRTNGISQKNTSMSFRYIKSSEYLKNRRIHSQRLPKDSFVLYGVNDGKGHWKRNRNIEAKKNLDASLRNIGIQQSVSYTIDNNITSLGCCEKQTSTSGIQGYTCIKKMCKTTAQAARKAKRKVYSKIQMKHKTKLSNNQLESNEITVLVDDIRQQMAYQKLFRTKMNDNGERHIFNVNHELCNRNTIYYPNEHELNLNLDLVRSLYSEKLKIPNFLGDLPTQSFKAFGKDHALEFMELILDSNINPNLVTDSNSTLDNGSDVSVKDRTLTKTAEREMSEDELLPWNIP